MTSACAGKSWCHNTTSAIVSEVLHGNTVLCSYPRNSNLPICRSAANVDTCNVCKLDASFNSTPDKLIYAQALRITVRHLSAYPPQHAGFLLVAVVSFSGDTTILTPELGW